MRIWTASILYSTLLFSALNFAQNARVNVDATRVENHISPRMYAVGEAEGRHGRCPRERRERVNADDAQRVHAEPMPARVERRHRQAAKLVGKWKLRITELDRAGVEATQARLWTDEQRDRESSTETFSS